MEQRNHEILGEYIEAIVSASPDPSKRKTFTENAHEATKKGGLYGPFEDHPGVAATLLQRALAAKAAGLPEELGGTVEDLAEALNVVLNNCAETNRDHRVAPEAKLPLNQTRRAIVEERFSMDALLPAAHAMHPDVAYAQVARADANFGRLVVSHPKGQALVANLNYWAWTGAIMSTASNMLSDSRSLSQIIAQESGQGMAHLRASNLILGTAAANFASTQKGAPFQLIDLGSGSGATLAAALKGISEVKGRSSFKVLGIEGTKNFYNGLKEDEVGLLRQVSANADILEGSGFVFGDMTEAISSVVKHSDSTRPTLVLANFALHRVPSVAKNMILEALGSLESVAVCIGDLVWNGSNANRRYFNFGFNGPSNCGHLGTGQVALKNGFRPFNLENHALPNLDPVLRGFAQKGPADDAHMIFLTKGEATEWANQWLNNRVR